MMRKVILITAFFIGLASVGQAQKVKLGHINTDELLQMMPETKLAQDSIQKYGEQLEKEMAEMESDLEDKVATFRANEKMWTTLNRQSKAEEIQELQQRIQDYGQRASEDLQTKQVELITPLLEKATKAINEVAKENGFTYIFDSSQSKAVLIYVDGGEDILPLVKAKLGI